MSKKQFSLIVNEDGHQDGGTYAMYITRQQHAPFGPVNGVTVGNYYTPSGFHLKPNNFPGVQQYKIMLGLPNNNYVQMVAPPHLGYRMMQLLPKIDGPQPIATLNQVPDSYKQLAKLKIQVPNYHHALYYQLPVVKRWYNTLMKDKIIAPVLGSNIHMNLLNSETDISGRPLTQQEMEKLFNKA